MPRTSLAALACLLLSACMQPQTPTTPTVHTLARNTLACRSQQSLQALHGAGNGFQREADNQMADGRCSMFSRGQRVTNGNAGSFVANGRQYWIYRWE